MTKYDLAIIGGGPAGYSAALEAIKSNLSVVLFEEKTIGGTCLNRGCVPTKFLLDFAKRYNLISNSQDRGLLVKDIVIDYQKTIEEKDNLVSKLRNNLETYMIGNNITIIKEKAEIIDVDKIKTSSGVYDAKHILIATGSKDRELNKKYHTTDELLDLNHLPKKINIIGGGVIAIEFAHIFNILDIPVSIFTRSERILRKWDKEISIAVAQSLMKHGVKICFNCDLNNLDLPDDEYSVCAIGRVPNASTSGFYNIDEQGGIIVDKNFETKTKNIFAAGDVISNSHMLAHTAISQGKAVARYIANKESSKQSYVASCIYFDPEIAIVGADEKELINNNIEYISAKVNLASNARTMISTKERTFIKMFVDKKTHHILGAVLLSERATDIADEILLAMNSGLTIDEFALNARPHPSYCEALTDLAEELIIKLK